MIIPRFSLRWLLALLTVCAGLSLVLSYAFQGHAWAIGFMVGLVSLLVVVALHAVTFSIAMLITQAGYFLAGNPPPGQSPFEEGTSPFAGPAPGTSDPEPPAIMS